MEDSDSTIGSRIEIKFEEDNAIQHVIEAEVLARENTSTLEEVTANNNLSKTDLKKSIIPRKGCYPAKWNHASIVQYCEVFNQVLDSQALTGEPFPKRIIFMRVTEALKERGLKFSCGEIEKKYSNMLLTYRRCYQRLMKKQQPPSWPYFKMVHKLKSKFEKVVIKEKIEIKESYTPGGQFDHSHPLEIQPITKKRIFDSYGINFPYVRSLPEQMEVPTALGQDWQKKRATQEEKKISMVQKLISEFESEQDLWKQHRLKLRDSFVKESKELKNIYAELNKAKEQWVKELRFCSEDISRISSVINNI